MGRVGSAAGMANNSAPNNRRKEETNMIEHADRTQQQKSPTRIRPPDASETTRDTSHADLSRSRAPALPRWLSLDQVRKLQRMRRETVLAAIATGELPCEQRGRIRYFRLTDVEAWEASRLRPDAPKPTAALHPDLADLA